MPFQTTEWINLKLKVTWKSVQANCFHKDSGTCLSLNEDNMFDDFSCVQKYYES
jgi:hypothetical protein